MIAPTILAEGEDTARRFIEFFTANIRNKNTWREYGHAVRGFVDWIEDRSVAELAQIEPVIVAGYIEDLGKRLSKPTTWQQSGCYSTGWLSAAR